MSLKFEYDKYLNQVEGLFPMPRIMAQLSAKLRSDATSVEDVSELLLSDTALVASIMKISNSSYFNYSEKSESLDEAIQRIGLGEIARMVSLSVADEVYQEELNHYRIPPDIFWESSIAAALLMESICGASGLSSDEGYLVGLMREIGMLVINLLLTEENQNVVWDGYVPVRDWEQEVCGSDHTEIGGKLLESWSFPTTVCDAVSGQWKGCADGGSLQQCLNLTNRILERTGCDFSIPIEDWGQFGKWLVELGLSGEELAQCVFESVSKFQRLRESVV